jgi:hypothetical protein
VSPTQVFQQASPFQPVEMDEGAFLLESQPDELGTALDPVKSRDNALTAQSSVL